MRFLLIALAFTLFLVASASQPNSNIIDPEERACAKSLTDLDDKIREINDNLFTTLKSARNNSTILSNFLESKDSNGFGTVDAGLQQATTDCKKINFPFGFDRTEVKKAYADLLRITEVYAYRLLILLNEVENIGADKVKSAKINLKELVTSNNRNYHDFSDSTLKLAPSAHFDGYRQISLSIIHFFETIIKSL